MASGNLPTVFMTCCNHYLQRYSLAVGGHSFLTTHLLSLSFHGAEDHEECVVVNTRSMLLNDSSIPTNHRPTTSRSFGSIAPITDVRLVGRRYVSKKDIRKNVVFISRQYHVPDRIRNKFRCGSFTWISGNPPQISDLACKVRIAQTW